MKAIETKGLTKYYNKARGIIDVDMTVEQGDFYGFIGPNGAGKSTTIRTLLGLIHPTGGDASILGLDVRTQSTEILQSVGYLPSEESFYHGMRVEEILNLSAKLRGMDCARERDLLCERLELDRKKRIGELSMGNRKKVGIVCAMQHRPDLYIMDEPTSGLDPLMQREFYSILKERNEEGATVFLSSHNLSEVERYCKHAGIIREGRLLVSDSIARLSHSSLKKVTVRGDCELVESSLIQSVERVNDTTSFLFRGEAKELLSLLGTLSFTDFTVCDPDLDEIFMHYYEKEAK